MNAVDYLRALPFPADRFQEEAAAALDRGESVVVAAPTGSGKTVVAEAAIAAALARGRRAVYTTPIKALSNQKYYDFCSQYGEGGVGLLTGDNSINGSAPVVVMTTEVLRNMMYARSPDLAGISVAVLDEVHYLQDRTRGAVWEEIIIHLDRSVALVCLSATVPNAAELRAWVSERRGPTALVMEETRPVPLGSTYLMRDRWEGGSLSLFDLQEHGKPNPALLRLLRRYPGRRRFGTPRRFETCEFLHRRRLLPAIYFIFSRAACNAAASQVVDFGLRLTTPAEATAIREVAAAGTSHLDPVDLEVLGYGRWLFDLEAGVAPHHAGMVPAFKETAERLFVEGLVKLVFATETLALGINMPARTVALEGMSKFTGEGHEMLTPTDYTQLTGRAGRRGIDRKGTAVVLHSPYVPVDQVLAIASPAVQPLRSSFRLTYNMAANLIASYSQPEAEALLNSSFAQFRDHQRRTVLQSRVSEAESRLEELEAEASCDLGAIDDSLPGSVRSRRPPMEVLATACSAGDILSWTVAGTASRHLVMARGTGRRPRLLVVSASGDLVRLAPESIPASAAIVGHIELPAPFRPRDPGYRRLLAGMLAGWTPDSPPRRPHLPEPTGGEGAICPDQERHRAAAGAARRTRRRLEKDRGALERLSGGLVPDFRRLLRLLQDWGYADGWRLTETGERLRFIYNELDLLLGESIAGGLFDDLDHAETAAVASLFTFEPRRADDDPRMPTRRCAQRADRIVGLWERLRSAESGSGLPETRPPEAGLATIAYRWATGETLEALFGDDSSGVGDFVRNCRQLIDLLRQVGTADPALAEGTAAAARALDRGVVAAVGMA